MTEEATPAGGRPAAPGALALVQEFVNTVDLETGVEQLGSPALLVAWLAQRALLRADEAAGADDLADALRLREAVRAVLYAHCCGEPDGGAAAVLAALAVRCPLAVQADVTGDLSLQPLSAGVTGALGRLLAAIYTASIEGSWARLKACREQACRWAFYDTSKNRSGAWCNMAVCGNRAKVRAYQRRRSS